MGKGFTLIELLAVIVILAIILLISMPIVLNVINDAKKGAFEASTRGLIKAAENNYMKNSLSGDSDSKTYIFEDFIQIEGDLKFSGKSPRNGYIHITSEGEIAAVIEDGNWLVKMELGEKDIITELFVDQNIETIFNGLIGTIYTITYDANEGECTPAIREIVHGFNAEAPLCEREGYIVLNYERTVGSGGELNPATGEITNVTGNQTILINWESVFVADYGTSFQTSYANLYSLTYPSGIPVHDLPSYGNHHFHTHALSGATSAIRHNQIDTARNYAIVYSGTNTYSLTTPIEYNEWGHVHIRAAGMTTNVNVGAFYLLFEDSAILTPQQAINQGYIEPLVLINSTHVNRHWTNVINLYNGGNTTTASYPEARITFKVKEISKVTAVRFYSSTNFNITYDGLSILSYQGIELSITPLE